MTKHEELTTKLAHLRDAKNMNALADDFAYTNGSNDRFVRDIAAVEAELKALEEGDADGIA